MKRVKSLIAAAERLSMGDYTVRVHASPDDALGQLGAAFNAMAADIQKSQRGLLEKCEELRVAREQVVQAERMDAIAKLASGVAHDFNNLLAIIIGEIDLALMFGKLPPQVRETFISIRRTGLQGVALSRQFLGVAGGQRFQPTVFNLDDLLSFEGTALRGLIPDDVRLVTRTSINAWVLADRPQIEQALRHLVGDACVAICEKGKLVLETNSVTLDESYTQTGREILPGEYVLLTISDTEGAITVEGTTHTLESIFATKALGKGTGLGLATCFEIVKQSGGHMAVYSEGGAGTVFKIFLPKVHAATQRLSEVREASDAAAASDRSL